MKKTILTILLIVAIFSGCTKKYNLSFVPIKGINTVMSPVLHGTITGDEKINLKLSNGNIISGYLSLYPVGPSTYNFQDINKRIDAYLSPKSLRISDFKTIENSIDNSNVNVNTSRGMVSIYLDTKRFAYLRGSFGTTYQIVVRYNKQNGYGIGQMLLTNGSVFLIHIKP